MGKRIEVETIDPIHVKICLNFISKIHGKSKSKTGARRWGTLTLDFATPSWHCDEDTISLCTEMSLQNSGHSFKYAGVNHSIGDGNDYGYFSSGLVQFYAETASSGMNASSKIFSATKFQDIDDTRNTVPATACQEVKYSTSRDFRDLRMIWGNEYEKVIGVFRDEEERILNATHSNSSSMCPSEWQVVDVQNAKTNDGVCLIRCPEIGAIFDLEWSKGSAYD